MRLWNKKKQAKTQPKTSVIQCKQTFSEDPFERLREIRGALKGRKGDMAQMLYEALKDNYFAIRLCAVDYLGNTRDRKFVPLLKPALFDFEKYVRTHAAEALAKIVGWREVIEIINKSRSTLVLPKTEGFFYDKTNLLAKEWLKKVREECGEPAFFHRGFPVFVSSRPGKWWGENKYGVFLLQKDSPQEFRGAILEHEFGEIFSHKLGNAFELVWLEEHDSIKKHIELGFGKEKEFFQIALEDPSFTKTRKLIPTRQKIKQYIQRMRKKGD